MPAAGVPSRMAVPSPSSVKLTPLGSDPVSVSDAVGRPVVVTVKAPVTPWVKVVWSAEVMPGATGRSG